MISEDRVSQSTCATVHQSRRTKPDPQVASCITTGILLELKIINSYFPAILKNLGLTTDHTYWERCLTKLMITHWFQGTDKKLSPATISHCIPPLIITCFELICTVCDTWYQMLDNIIQCWSPKWQKELEEIFTHIW